MTKYEVRMGTNEDWVVVSRRFSRADAYKDVELLAMFGRKAWVKEL